MPKNLKPTKTQAYIEAAKCKLGGVTDYRLAQVMEIPRQMVSHYQNGSRHADAYACARLAIILKIDPLEIIAAVEADSAKNDQRRAFWMGFPSGLRRTALGLALSATFGFSGVGWPGGAEAGSTSHNDPLRQRQERRKMTRDAGFFSAV